MHTGGTQENKWGLLTDVIGILDILAVYICTELFRPCNRRIPLKKGGA